MWNETRNEASVAAHAQGGARLESPLVGAGDALKAYDARGSKQFRFRERPFLDLVNVRGEPNDPAFVRAFEQVVGCRPPVKPNTVARGADHDVLWLGPDEWLVRSNGAVAAGALEAKLAQAVQGLYAAAVDVGSGYTVVEVSGARATCSRAAARSICTRACSASGSARRAITSRRRSRSCRRATIHTTSSCVAASPITSAASCSTRRRRSPDEARRRAVRGTRSGALARARVERIRRRAEGAGAHRHPCARARGAAARRDRRAARVSARAVGGERRRLDRL
ncbi:sarcosine oxidase, gamma subunit [Burkholderia mallei]|nr:sarcosine oxidase, gamma subunit [Burkholderia mallei]KOS93927.1 sarcosine oxidase, gamma subunit [Burkholderia mallei]KOT21992.1 sarcosine oxidase, gamma subunit [Burkholderia mallei]